MIQSFDARSGRPLGPERRIGECGDVTLLATAAAGAWSDRRRGAHDRPRRAHAAPAAARAFRCGAATLSPDDRTLLVGGRDGSVRFLDLWTGDVVRASGRHDGRVSEAASAPTDAPPSPPAPTAG